MKLADVVVGGRYSAKVSGARTRRKVRQCEFRMVHGVLVRSVKRPGSRSYQHRCTLESFADVARFIEEQAGAGVTTNMLWTELKDVPCTQATVALEFLKDRGCVEVQQRRCRPLSECFFDDALCEWQALAFQCELEGS